MSNASVLRALSTVTSAQLKFATLVKLIEGDEETLCYLCLGKHRLFIVDKEMNFPQGGMYHELPYHALQRCEFDREEDFTICFSEHTGKPTDDVDQVLHFRCAERDRFLSEFDSLFRTDYMFQHWQLPKRPFLVPSDAPLSDMEDIKDLLPSQSLEYSRETLGNYVFLRPKAFERQSSHYAALGAKGTDAHSTAAKASSYARYSEKSSISKAQPDFIDIIIYNPGTLMSKAISPILGQKENIQEVVEKKLKEIGELVVDYRVVDPIKQFNRKSLVGGRAANTQDKARFECWKAHIQTAKSKTNKADGQAVGGRDIRIIAIQRRFLPPMMDKFQNILIISMASIGSPSLEKIEMVANSFTCPSRSFTIDRLVVQTKANALMLDEDSYRFYSQNLQIFPDAHKLSTDFCHSILRVVSEANVSISKQSFGIDLSRVSDDPFQYSTTLEKQVPGVTDSGSSTGLVREWKARVWRYLAFCIDGGLNKFPLDITKLAHIAQQTEQKACARLISKVLQALLYFRAVGEDYRPTELTMKIADEASMVNATFNEHVMHKLLNSGYIRWSLDTYADLLEYPRFLVRLLQEGRKVRKWHSLLFAVCDHIVTISACVNLAETIPSGRQSSNRTKEVRLEPFQDFHVQIIVPGLIDILNDESCDDESIHVMIVSALVNFTKKNPNIKNKVMAGGAIRQICKFLHSKNDDLVRHSCSLLNNCTKADQYRGQVAKFGAIEALMNLLQRSSLTPAYRSPRILIQASAVIGNLASDSELRQKITGALGYQNVSYPSISSSQFKDSRSISVLVDLLVDRCGDITKYRENLRVTVINALKNLAVRDDVNKRNIGRLATEPLVSILHSSTEEKNKVLLDVTLRCIYVLSMLKENCVLLQRNKVIEAIAKHQPAFKDLVKGIQKRVLLQ